MRMAERIQQIRLACWVTLEDVEAKTGFTKSQMVRLETGQEAPTLEMLDTLAEALDVPILVFFYDTAEPKSAPRLEPRLALKEPGSRMRRFGDIGPVVELRQVGPRGNQGMVRGGRTSPHPRQAPISLQSHCVERQRGSTG